MLMVIVFLLTVFAFLGWLAYVAYRDPAGIFRLKPRRDDGNGEPGPGEPGPGA